MKKAEKKAKESAGGDRYSPTGWVFTSPGVTSVQGCHTPITTKFPLFVLCS